MMMPYVRSRAQVVHLQSARASAPAQRLPPRLCPPPFGQRCLANRLRLSERAALPAQRAVGLAQDWQGHIAQPPPPPLSRGLPLDATRDAGRPRPGPDPARRRGAAVGGVEAITAAPGWPVEPQAGP